MNEQEITLTPIELLIKFYSKELFVEIVYNGDSSKFWTKADDYIFSASLTSFREGLKSLVDGMNEDREMFNYFSAFCFRMFSQPFTQPALDVFVEGFDLISKDAILSSGFQWTASNLTTVERLILFLTVHRNEITIAMNKRAMEEKAELGKTPPVKRGGKKQ